MKQKGFTLIELLAVIVILAIIALIATPIVLNIINDTKESSLFRSAEFYLDAVETAVAQSTLNDKKLENKTYNILEDGNLCIEYKDDECINKLEVKISGEVPSSGSITIENGKIKDIQIVLSKKTMVKDNDKWIYSGLYDENDNLIATWDELVNIYGIDIEKDYGDNDQTAPGRVLTSNEKLSKGVKLVIDSSVAKIGRCAIRMGINLKEIIISNSVITIGGYAFGGCTNLKEIKIPNGVISIDHNAFNGCSSLEKVTLPNSVTSIGKQAFYNCASLKETTLSNNITSIGFKMFYRCRNLEKIEMHNGVTIIDSESFEGCTSLKEITIPNSVTSIGKWAFNEDGRLKTINYVGTKIEWDSIEFGIDWNRGMPSDYTINYNYAVN